MPPPVWFLRPKRLHWLRVPKRVKFKLCVFAYRRTSQTTYSARLLMATDITSDLLTRQLWWLDLPDAQRSATVRFPWQLLVLGTVFHQPSGTRHHFCRSGAAWRHGFLNWHCNTDFTGCSSFRFDVNSVKCPCNVSMTVSLWRVLR